MTSLPQWNNANTSESILEVRDLHIVTVEGESIVRNVNLSMKRGEILAIIGASGSGKTTLALTALGRLRPGLVVSHGSVVLCGTDMLKAPLKQRNSLRSRVVAYVAQSAAASFNPRLRLISQVIESALLHRTQTKQEATRFARKNFALLGLPDTRETMNRFPHEVSGGQLQRFMIAMGLQEGPLLLVCDEPTSALDVTTQVEVVSLLKRAIRQQNTGALFISHDLAVVAQIATRIGVMRAGELVEIGPTEQILDQPQHAYTKKLLAACRQFSITSPSETSGSRVEGPVALEVKNIVAGYGKGVDGQPRATILKDVSVSVRSGEVVALIGESGSGKSTLARVIAGLHAPSLGEVKLNHTLLAGRTLARSKEERRKIQLVYQSADTALNPRQPLRRILGRTLAFYHRIKGPEAEARMTALLELVRLPNDCLNRQPSELSGGEKQRANLARALAADPQVLICDEITSALDTVVAEALIDLIEDLRSRLNLAILFISHDLATVSSLADRVLVLRHGREVETGQTSRVLSSPQDQYTRLLVDSVPQLRRGWLEEAAAARATSWTERETVQVLA